MRLWRESVWGNPGGLQNVCKDCQICGKGRYGSGAVSPASQATAFSSSWRINWRTQSIRVLRLLQVLHELQARGTVQAEVLGLLLQQADQPHRIDVVFLVKFDHAAFSLLSSLRIPQFAALADAGGRYPAGCGRHRAGGQNDRSAQL